MTEAEEKQKNTEKIENVEDDENLKKDIDSEKEDEYIEDIESIEKNENHIGKRCNDLKIAKKSHKKVIIISLIAIILLILAMSVLYFCEVPIIKYNGNKNEIIEYGDTFVDKGIDIYTKFRNITYKVDKKSNVDKTKVGNYVITYTVPYFSSSKTYTRNVKIVDTKAPIITLNGKTDEELSYGTEYKEQGFCAKDNYDGDITNNVKVEKIKKDEEHYEIHYTVSDSSNNKAEVVRNIKITDKIAPKITLNGNAMISLIKGDTYTEQGAKAIDNKDGDISNKIKISGSVDTSKDGTYTISYTVNDSSGNVATEKRKVIVGDSKVNGIVYLTFDDGPSSTITPKILDVLKEKGVNATFFIINYSNENEVLVKRAVNEGNAIGIHGYSHDYSTIYSSLDSCYDNIIKLQDKIYKSTGIKTKILRFPGGSSNTVSKKYCQGIMTEVTQKVLKEGFRYYDWNVLSGDSGDVKTEEGVYNNVTKGLKAGRNNIVLMHDFKGNNKTLDALPKIIDYGLANGYKFEVITTDTEMVTQKVQN